jgi:hypothetical protein
LSAFAALFAGHAFVACFGACFGLCFRCGVVVEGSLAFGITTFTTSTAVAVLAWAASFAATLAATAFTALFHIAFAALSTLAACWPFVTRRSAPSRIHAVGAGCPFHFRAGVSA